MKSLSFNEQMARAYYAGLKSRTWRPMKKQPGPLATLDHVDQFGTAVFTDGTCICAPYLPSEIVYIRETWQQPGFEKPNKDYPELVIYRADNATAYELMKWRPSIHMFEWASRSHARIISCLPTRVQSTTEDEAIRGKA